MHYCKLFKLGMGMLLNTTVKVLDGPPEGGAKV
jgi:hypothetical protein